MNNFQEADKITYNVIKRRQMDYTMTMKAFKNKEGVISDQIKRLADYIDENSNNLDTESIKNQLEELNDFINDYGIW